MEGSPVSSVSRNRNTHPLPPRELQDLTGPHFLYLQSRKLLQLAWKGAPPSAAEVKGQKAEGGADKGGCKDGVGPVARATGWTVPWRGRAGMKVGESQSMAPKRK